MNKLRGSERAVSLFERQLEAVHGHKGVVVGRLAREAMYDQFGWGGAEPIDVINRGYSGAPDIDLVFASDQLLRDDAAKRPHHLDREFGDNHIWREKGGLVVVSGYGLDELKIAADAARILFRPVTRKLDGRIPVRTFSIGVHQQLEGLSRLPNEYYQEIDYREYLDDEELEAYEGEGDMYEARRRQFDDFAEWAREDHPEEFPSPDALAPLIQANKIISAALGVD